MVREIIMDVLFFCWQKVTAFNRFYAVCVAAGNIPGETFSVLKEKDSDSTASTVPAT